MNDIKKRFVSIKFAESVTGLDRQTIRKMVDKSQINGYKTPSGQRRIDIQSIQAMCSNGLSDEKIVIISKQNFIYARVSTKKQMDDLSRQIEFLRKPEYINYILIQDIGYGINFKRKGLSTILDACLQRTIGQVVVAHRDRLSRFAFDLIELFITKAGGTIKVLDNENDSTKSSEQELSEDLLSIIHIFNCRQMGKRSYIRKTIKIDKDQIIPN